MIKGLGIDTIFVDKVERAARNERFLEKCFTKTEIELFRKRGSNPQFLAGNFAVKEAVVKAFGTGFVGFFPRDVEVLRDEAGKPFIVLYGKAKKTAAEVGAVTIHVSITNTKELASAVAVIE